MSTTKEKEEIRHTQVEDSTVEKLEGIPKTTKWKIKEQATARERERVRGLRVEIWESLAS